MPTTDRVWSIHTEQSSYDKSFQGSRSFTIRTHVTERKTSQEFVITFGKQKHVMREQTIIARALFTFASAALYV